MPISGLRYERLHVDLRRQASALCRRPSRRARRGMAAHR
ncbi:putative leader peptide [Actinomadura luteofluorescens]